MINKQASFAHNKFPESSIQSISKEEQRDDIRNLTTPPYNLRNHILTTPPHHTQIFTPLWAHAPLLATQHMRVGPGVAL